MHNRMSVEKRISAIIPSYNRISTIGRALESVLKQTYGVSEIILVNDGSTDKTEEWVAVNFPDVTVIHQENQGVSAARNIGIQHATTDWIAFLDSDDVWYDEKLEKQVKALEGNPDCLMCHTEEQWIYNGKPKIVPESYRKKGGWIFEDCLPRCAIAPSAALIHRSIFEKVGWFDESLPVCEDYDLWLRITSRHPVLLVNEPLIEKHGGHGDQLSNQREMDRYRIQALAKLLGTKDLKEDYRALAHVQFQKKCIIYAEGLEKHGRAGEAIHYRTLADGL